MELINLQTYQPDTDTYGNGALYLKDETGKDWYESQPLFTKANKIAYEPDTGIIRLASTDVSMLFPIDMNVVDVDELPEGFNTNSEWQYTDGSIVPRVYTSAEQIATATATRDALISEARQTMNEWQNDLALGDISDEDKALLIAWNNYVKALKALDLSTAPNISWPAAPQSST